MEKELDEEQILTAYNKGELSKREAQSLLQKIGADPWLRSKSKQQKIITSGVNKTTPGLQRKPTGMKIPIDIKGRHYRDIKKADLTEIEGEHDRQARIAKELALEVKTEINNRKKAKQDKELQEKVEQAIKERSEPKPD